METIIMKNETFKWPLINDNVSEEDKESLIKFIKEPNVRFTQSKYVKEFEKKWSEWLGVKHTVFVNSGASANYIMASIAKEVKGVGEVIVPPIGWVSDISPLVNLGMTPVFVDVDMKTLAISAEHIRRAITPETKAIVLVHALGFNGINEQIVDIAKEHDLMLIEDCCESHGALWGDKKIGTFGHMSNFSFYFGHHMTTVEGGVVCTDDDDLYEYIKMFRSHGMTREASEEIQHKYQEKYPRLNPLFTFAVPGYNVRNTEFNAVLGLSQLKRLDDNVAKRKHNFELWNSQLDSKIYYTGYNTIGNSNFSLPLILQHTSKETLQKVCLLLEDEGVEYRLGTAGGGNQARQPYLTEGRYTYRVEGVLANADHIHDYGLYIGNHTELNDGSIITLCDKLNKILEG